MTVATAQFKNHNANSPPLPPALPGFAQVRRYFDKEQQCFIAVVAPGEYYVSGNEEVISTVLGSCVSACIRDPLLNVGGLNHFMLPTSASGETSWNNLVSASNRYGAFAMESLINALIKLGAARSRLEVKLFGGGHILDINVNVGEQNIAFVNEFLRREKLAVIAQDTGGVHARHLIYNPISGVARVRKIERSQTANVSTVEKKLLSVIVQQPIGGSVELFD